MVEERRCVGDWSSVVRVRVGESTPDEFLDETLVLVA